MKSAKFKFDRDELLEELYMFYEAAGFDAANLEDEFSVLSDDELMELVNNL